MLVAGRDPRFLLPDGVMEYISDHALFSRASMTTETIPSDAAEGDDLLPPRSRRWKTSRRLTPSYSTSASSAL